MVTGYFVKSYFQRISVCWNESGGEPFKQVFTFMGLSIQIIHAKSRSTRFAVTVLQTDRQAKSQTVHFKLDLASLGTTFDLCDPHFLS